MKITKNNLKSCQTVAARVSFGPPLAREITRAMPKSHTLPRKKRFERGKELRARRRRSSLPRSKRFLRAFWRTRGADDAAPAAAPERALEVGRPPARARPLRLDLRAVPVRVA